MSKDHTPCKVHVLGEDCGKRPTVYPRVTTSTTQGRLRRYVFDPVYDFYKCLQCGLYCYTLTGRPVGGGKMLFKNGLFFEKDGEGLFFEKDAEGLCVNIDAEGLFVEVEV
jgi:hypothetical protein